MLVGHFCMRGSLQRNLSNCWGQTHDNGANMKKKSSRCTIRNPQNKSLSSVCTVHKPFIESIYCWQCQVVGQSLAIFWCCIPYIFVPESLEYLKDKCMIVYQISITRWERSIHCIKSLRYYLTDILKIL